MTIQHPALWGLDRISEAARELGGTEPINYWPEASAAPRPVIIRRIELANLRTALQKGAADFAANRTDILCLCLVYPLLGFLLARMAFGYQVLPLLFPLVAGFALVGPVAGIGLYEMSRRRELGAKVTWFDAFGVLRSPSIFPIACLSLLLGSLFVLWMMAASAIYDATIGPGTPPSLASFAHDVLATPMGWTMIILGCGIGGLFAATSLAISVVSFPLLLDRNVGLEAAISASLHAVWENRIPLAAWGLIVAACLVAGSIPLLLGIPIVLPLLGHATWHLYRQLVER